jgi:hypothetical protein
MIMRDCRDASEGLLAGPVGAEFTAESRSQVSVWEKVS